MQSYITATMRPDTVAHRSYRRASVFCRLLADNHICNALMQALQPAVVCPDTTHTASADFSIAAVKSAVPTSMSQSTRPASAVLPAALLRAAIAFSTSMQLSEQMLSAGIMAPIAALLNKGSVHNHHTSLAVDLLWNLLEACPVSDANTMASSAAANSTLAARHSQILRPKHKMPKARNKSRDKANYSRDAEPESSDGHDSAAECDGQDEEEDTVSKAQASIDEACSQDVAASEEALDEEAEPASAEQLTSNISMAAGSAAGIEADADTAAVREDDATAGHTEAAALSGAPDSTSSAEIAAADLPQTTSNSQADSDHGSTALPLATEADDSAMTDHQSAGASSAEHKARVNDEIAAGIVKVLTDCLENGYSTADKELRNTVLIVAGMLAESSRYRAALCCDEMLQQLLLAGTEPELGDCSTAYLRVRSTLISNDASAPATSDLPMCFAAACYTAKRKRRLQQRMFHAMVDCAIALQDCLCIAARKLCDRRQCRLLAHHIQGNKGHVTRLT